MPSNGSIGFCLNDFIITFENRTTRKINKYINNKKYIPQKIDINCIKSFFEVMRNKNVNNDINI